MREREPEQHGDTTSMKVEITHFDSYPTYRATENALRQVLAEEGIQADIELVAVNSEEEARRLRFPGSPTIRVDGRDLFPTPEREDWRLVCRVYATPEGLIGSPTAQMLKAALLSKEGSSRTAGLETPVRVRHIHYPGDEAVEQVTN